MNISKIKVAMVAPPFGETGGPEVVVRHLTDALLALGVSVTLFAPADWQTKAKLVPTLKQSLWNMPDFKKQTEVIRRNYLIASQVAVLNHQEKFDLIHLHLDKYAYPIAATANRPCVLTLHNPIDPTEFRYFSQKGIYTVALTRAQRGNLRVSATIGNGIPVNKIKPSFGRGRYLIFVGRLSARKGVDRAIRLARRAKEKLIIFGRIGNSPERQEFYNRKIKPFIDQQQIIYRGETSNQGIMEAMRGAKALLFPIAPPEPFGLVTIEALACGTPVIGTRVAPLPEILANRRAAFLSNNDQQLVRAIKRTDQLFDRRECRRYAEKKFDSLVMARKYVKLYQRILNRHKR